KEVCKSLFRNITKRQWTIFFLIIILILAFYFVLPISIPLIIALFTAMILNPAVRLFQHQLKMNRKYSVIVVFLLFLLLLGIAGTFTVTKAIGQVVNFVEDVPIYINQVNSIYRDWEYKFQQYAINLPPEFVKQMTDSLQDNLLTLNATIREKITIENIAQIFSKVPQYLI